VIPTGFDKLDQCLPGGGWPLGAMTEVLVKDINHSPLWLMAPALSVLSKQARWQTWIAPPHIPFAPALNDNGIELSRTLLVRPSKQQDALWAAEESLRSGSCSVVLFWAQHLDRTSLRRLQLAAEHGQAWMICFCTDHTADSHTSAALRVQCQPHPDGTQLNILKCRGGRSVNNLMLSRHIPVQHIPSDMSCCP
jgi:cell division inhibitor SulA/protein ImuA